MNTLIFLFLLLTTGNPHKIEDVIKEPNTCTNYNDSEKSDNWTERDIKHPIKLKFETRVSLQISENQLYIYGYCSAHNEFLLVAYLDNFTDKYHYNPKFLK